jgi:hypothetical protein
VPKRVSAVLGVVAADLNATGAFNGFVDIDSRLHVDPHLLAASSVPELAGSRQRFEGHFRKVLKLLRHSKQKGDQLWNGASKLIQSKEIPQTGLGYAKHDTGGSGIGPLLAGRLTGIAKEITDAGVADIEIFELLGLLQEGIGADRISDMTVSVILPDLLAFSERVGRDLRTPTAKFEHDGKTFAVPLNRNTGQPIVLVPRDILRRLPTAASWSDVDRVAAHNEQLRRRVNPIIGDTWKKATSAKIGKDVLRKTLNDNPELVVELVKTYRSKPKAGYDFDKDPEAVFVWHAITEELALAAPLGLQLKGPLDRDGLLQTVKTICARFKELVEDNRLSRLLYNDDKSPRKEKAAQLAFFGIANAYCEANDFDISPEADGGAGPVDFKISKGYQYRVVVEMKLSSNSSLVHGFEAQLPNYQKAEKALHSVYLVVKNGNHDLRIKKLEAARQTALKKKLRVPDLLVVDGRLRPAASRR